MFPELTAPSEQAQEVIFRGAMQERVNSFFQVDMPKVSGVVIPSGSQTYNQPSQRNIIIPTQQVSPIEFITPRQTITPKAAGSWFESPTQKQFNPTMPTQINTPKEFFTPQENIMPRSITLPREITTQKGSSLPQEIYTPKEIVIPKEIVTPREIVIPREIITPREPPPYNPPDMPIWGGGGGGPDIPKPGGGGFPIWLPQPDQETKSMIANFQGKARSGYQPSFTATMFNLRGKVTSTKSKAGLAELSGIALRPLPTLKRKKK
jgi:hypothetical protein